MLKKTITYSDLDGNPVTEDFYFNLSKAEIAEMEVQFDGGLSKHLEKVVESQNGAEIITAFKDIISKAIGRRSDDGKRFIKSPDIAAEFFETDAWSVLFMELLTDGNEAAKFVNGMMPPDLVDEATGKKIENVGSPEGPKDDTPAYIREGREPTKAELQKMSHEELQEAFRRKSAGADQ